MSQNFSEKYLAGTRSTKAIYGIILITAALIGLQVHETSPLAVSIKIFLAALVIVLAEVYSEQLGEKIRRKKQLSKFENQDIINSAMVIASVSVYPAVIFVLSSFGLYSIETAFDISYLLSIIGLGLFGFIAARAAGNSRSSSYKSAVLASAIGATVIIIKYIFSH